MIRGTVTLLDPKKLNVGTTVFVTVKTSNYSEAWYKRFVHKKLIAGCEFLDISASFAMGAIKHTTALPLDHLLVSRS